MRKSKKKAEPHLPVKQMGKYYGYKKFSDGSIEIARPYQEQFDTVNFNRRAIEQLLSAVTAQCAAMLAECNANVQRVWTQLSDDYGIDSGPWEYSKGRIFRPKEEDSEGGE